MRRRDPDLRLDSLGAQDFEALQKLSEDRLSGMQARSRKGIPTTPREPPVNPTLSNIPGMEELNIGFSIIARAVFSGLLGLSQVEIATLQAEGVIAAR